MKTIGLIGGMSWESTERYYRLINEGVRDRLGELHSADIVMDSRDFYDLEKLQKVGDWNGALAIIEHMEHTLYNAGANCIVICSVTGHAKELHTPIPVIHIADTVNNKIKSYKKVGLLGTKYTMEMDYFKSKIQAEVIVPDEEDRKTINSIIYNELCQGYCYVDAEINLQFIIERLIGKGAEAVILGCTELGLLTDKEYEFTVPILDSTIIHANAAVDFALKGE